METEIVGIDNFMPAIWWTQYFIVSQRYNVRNNCLHQYNNSFIILKNNGNTSSSKSTKHNNIRYFSITDRVKNVEVLVVWCPTGDKIVYYMTKTLQCAMFRKFRDQIMGVIPDSYPGPVKVKVEQLRKA